MADDPACAAAPDYSHYPISLDPFHRYRPHLPPDRYTLIVCAHRTPATGYLHPPGGTMDAPLVPAFLVPALLAATGDRLKHLVKLVERDHRRRREEEGDRG